MAEPDTFQNYIDRINAHDHEAKRLQREGRQEEQKPKHVDRFRTFLSHLPTWNRKREVLTADSKSEASKIEPRSQTLYELVNQKSPEIFADDVQEIRNLRSLDRKEAKKRIDELRKKVVEQQYKGIELQRELFDYLEHSENATEEGFLEKIRHIHPNEDEREAMRKIFQKFGKSKKVTLDVLESLLPKNNAKEISNFHEDRFENIPEPIRREMAMNAFKLFTGKTASSTKPPELHFFPYAIELQVNDPVDSLVIHPEQTGAGYYEDRKEIEPTLGALSRFIGFRHLLGVPFIFVDLSLERVDRYGTSSHERAHAENATVSRGLKSVDQHKTIWGGKELYQEISSSRLTVDSILKKFQQGRMDDAALVGELRLAVADYTQQALSGAKDELIADFSARGTFDHLKYLLLDTVETENEARRQNQKSRYRYFKAIGFSSEKFQSPPLREAYNTIAREYDEILENNVNQIAEMCRVWKKFDDYGQKKEQLIAFLRQNPLHTWAIRSKKYFEIEMRDRRGLIEKATKLQDQIKQREVRCSSISDLEREMRRKAAELRKKGIAIEASDSQEMLDEHLEKLRLMQDEIASPESRGLFSADKMAKVDTENVVASLAGIDEKLSSTEDLLREQKLDLENATIDYAKNHTVSTFLDSQSRQTDAGGEMSDVVTRLRTDWDNLLKEMRKLDKLIVPPQKIRGEPEVKVDAFSLIMQIEDGKQPPEEFLKNNERVFTFLKDKVFPAYRQRKEIADALLDDSRYFRVLNSAIVQKLNDELEKRHVPKLPVSDPEILSQMWYGDLLDAVLAGLSDGDRQKVIRFADLRSAENEDMKKVVEVSTHLQELISNFMSNEDL